MKNNPIGLFDSGVGGTSIWKEVHQILPNENTIYLADSRNAPYGYKTTEEIKTTIEEKISKWYETLGTKIKEHDKLHLKEMHIFLMPFPSVEKFREYFLAEIN